MIIPKKILNGEAIIDNLSVEIDKKVFGTNVNKHGSAFFTSTRLIFYVKNRFRKDYSKQISIDSIVNISLQRELLSTKILVDTNDSRIEIKPFQTNNLRLFFFNLKKMLNREIISGLDVNIKSSAFGTILNKPSVLKAILNTNISSLNENIKPSVFGTTFNKSSNPKTLLSTNISGVVYFTSNYIQFYADENNSKTIQIDSITDVTLVKKMVYTKGTFHTKCGDILIASNKHYDIKQFVEKFKPYMLASVNKTQQMSDSIKYQINGSNPLKVGVENPIKITITNPTEIPIYDIQIQFDISALVNCDITTAKIKTVPPKSSKHTAILITPRFNEKIDVGDLYVSYDFNGKTYENGPIAIGTYETVEENLQKSTTHIDDMNSDLSISRENEFYQGFIRFKMSVTNTSSFVVHDVALDFDFDEKLLRIDKREPDYQIKNGRTIFGNISANSSKTVAVYFDPMMCSKGADINCQINYKDAKGQPQTTHMKPKKISVVCPIMETESDINIGRLKEFIEKLPYRDSKVYQVQNGFDIDVLKNISREIVQKHDVKHIRTLFTKDGGTCEIWYYGKTKVHSHDIVIKITILSETQNIELFAATETVESLAGLLAEVGRELKSAIESKVTGNVQQVINVSIKDSIVQRSNLLSYCDIDGNCSGDVVIEDSLVTRSEIGFDAEVKDSLVQKTNVGGNSCPACGEVLAEGAKFCMECGGKLI